MDLSRLLAVKRPGPYRAVLLPSGPQPIDDGDRVDDESQPTSHEARDSEGQSEWSKSKSPPRSPTWKSKIPRPVAAQPGTSPETLQLSPSHTFNMPGGEARYGF